MTFADAVWATVISAFCRISISAFEVYFDDEKSFAVFAERWGGGNDENESISAGYTLAKFQRTKFLALTEDWLKTGNEKQQQSARYMLAKLKTGGFDSAKLQVQNKDRYFLGEDPNIAILVQIYHSAPLTTKDFEYQKFSIELTGAFGGEPKQETKTCLYTGGIAQRQSDPDRNYDYEERFLTADLSKCFYSRFSVGKYRLMVKSADGREALKYQEVVREFEIYFDEEKSVYALAHMLKSVDTNERNWAVSNLARHNRNRLVTLLEELIKSGNENQRDFASRILAEIKAGRFGPSS